MLSTRICVIAPNKRFPIQPSSGCKLPFGFGGQALSRPLGVRYRILVCDLHDRLVVRAMEVGTYVPLGEYFTPKAFRRDVRGVIEGFYMVLWNAEKP